MSKPMGPKMRLACLLGLAALVLAACGGSARGLIPASNAGPLQEDFEAVARAAHEGNGSCGATEHAIAKTERDLRALPQTVDAALLKTLSEGVSNLRRRALEACSARVTESNATESTLSEAARSHTKTRSTSTETERSESEATKTETSSTSTSTSTSESSTTTPGAKETNPGGVEAPAVQGNEQGEGNGPPAAAGGGPPAGAGH
jgi:hypothetical protein